jgi:hypothetical protein
VLKQSENSAKRDARSKARPRGGAIGNYDLQNLLYIDTPRDSDRPGFTKLADAYATHQACKKEGPIKFPKCAA